jgi:predicted PurR-regulated permease PerM
VAAEIRDDLKPSPNAFFTALLLVALLYFAREVFVPLALAALIAFVLAPAANRLERLGMKRTPAAVLVIVLTLAGVSVLGWVLLGQVYSLAVEIPQYQQNMSDKIGSLHLDSANKLSRTVEMLNNLNKRIKNENNVQAPVLPLLPVEHAGRRAHANLNAATKSASPAANPAAPPVAVRIEAPEQSMIELAGQTLTPLVHPLTTTFIVVIFLVFMLTGREDLRDRGLKLAGSGRMHVTTTAIKDATHRVSRYLQMELVVNLSYGAIIGVALQLIGIPHPFLWASLTCVLRFVPYVGIMLAAAGPLLLAVAVFPHWAQLLWTVLAYAILELIAANFLEPMLYAASTGISSIAVLIAAVFWTFLWGLPGLLLSTPLTVCLIVIGRQVPRLHYLEVLFGERTGLPPSEYFYQRMLAANPRDARALVVTTLKTKSRAEVFDTVMVPALAMIEAATATEEMTAARAEEVLQSVEDLVEELVLADGDDAGNDRRPPILCVPARDFADEIASLMAQQVLREIAAVEVASANVPLADFRQRVLHLRPEIICVIGVPPRAIRYTRMRCHQIRARFPESIVVACILGDEKDLSSLRSLVPSEDAQHVVSSLQLLVDYLTSVLHPDRMAAALAETGTATESGKALSEESEALEQMDPFDGPDDGVFARLATNLARSLDAPIALIAASDGEHHLWESHCGLSEDPFAANGSLRDCSICTTLVSPDAIHVVPDVAEDERFCRDPFLLEHGIRFCVTAPLIDHDDKLVGSLCVLDTRPRQITDKQKETLLSVAAAVITAIEMSGSAHTAEFAPHDEVSVDHS